MYNVAAQANQSFPYEFIFRSAHHLLVSCDYQTHVIHVICPNVLVSNRLSPTIDRWIQRRQNTLSSQNSSDKGDLPKGTIESAATREATFTF